MYNISEGHSETDRISFSDFDTQASAIMKPDGTIEIEYVSISERSKQTLKQISPFDFLKALFFWIGLPCIKVQFILPFILKTSSAAYLYFLPAIFTLIFSIHEIINVRKKGEEILKNHAAEHQVLEAYLKLKKVPSLEEAKSFSRISRHCGISAYSSLVTGQIIGFLFFYFGNIIIPEWIIMFVPLMCCTIFPFHLLGKFGQLFTTSPSEDKNINLALCALNALLNKSQKDQNNSD